MSETVDEPVVEVEVEAVAQPAVEGSTAEEIQQDVVDPIIESEATVDDTPTFAPPPVPSFPPDFPPVEDYGEGDVKESVNQVEGQNLDVVEEVVPAAKSSIGEDGAAHVSKRGPSAVGDFFIIRKQKEKFFSAPIYSIELYDPEGTPESTYRIYAQNVMALKPYFSISGDKEDFGKKREKRSHLFVGKLVVENPKKIYIGAIQNTEDRIKSHMVSIVYDQIKGDPYVKMEVAVTLVPTPTLHDEYMLMRVNGSQNNSRVNELLVLKDTEASTSMSQIMPMKMNGKKKSVPSNTLFALTKVQSTWGKTQGAEESKYGDKPDDFVYMQFGKIRESKLYPETADMYSCQFQDPITMVTAFMIILSRFDCMK